MAEDMSDKAREVASDLVDKAQEAVERNRDRIDGAIDKAEELADRATGGRFSDKIERAGDAARDRVGDVASDDTAGEQGPQSKLKP